MDIGPPLEAVGLGALADLPAAYLSAGQRRRLSIARLLAVKRPIWLLDEPTSTLDATAQERLAGFMRTHLAGGGLIMAATHGADRARRRAGAALGGDDMTLVAASTPSPGGGGSARTARRDGVISAARRTNPNLVRCADRPTPCRGTRIMTPLAAILIRDMRIAVRVGGGALMGVLFFLVVVTLIPFALGPDLALLKRIGPAILWLAALLASLLALDRLFAADHEDGSLDLHPDGPCAARARRRRQKASPIGSPPACR